MSSNHSEPQVESRSGQGAAVDDNGDELSVARDGAIVTLTLNRPASYNALSEALLTGLLNQFKRIGEDPSAHVVILAANGRAFCAGHDLKQMRANPGQEYQRHLFGLCSNMMLAMTEIPQVVLAKVQGPAVAAGCQLVANADLAIAADSAKFAVSGINLGLFCGTPSVALTRNIPRKRALEMLFRGTSIDASTAVDYDLINACVPDADLDATINAWAEDIAAKSHPAIAMGKRLYYKQIDQNLAQAYQSATEMMADNMMLDSTQRRIDAFIDKRKS
jgi:enoyl-CoA hydratase/carnithine racemase